MRNYVCPSTATKVAGTSAVDTCVATEPAWLSCGTALADGASVALAGTGSETIGRALLVSDGVVGAAVLVFVLRLPRISWNCFGLRVG